MVKMKMVYGISLMVLGYGFLRAEVPIEKLKIGYVDTITIMQEMDEGQKLKKEFEARQMAKAQELEKERQVLIQEASEYNNKASMLNAESRDRQEQRLARMQRELEHKAREAQEELKLEMQRATERIAFQVDKAIAKIAAREQFDKVHCVSTGKVWSLNKKADISEIVKNELNTDHRQLVAAQTQTPAPVAGPQMAQAPAAHKNTKDEVSKKVTA